MNMPFEARALGLGLLVLAATAAGAVAAQSDTFTRFAVADQLEPGGKGGRLDAKRDKEIDKRRDNDTVRGGAPVGGVEQKEPDQQITKTEPKSCVTDTSAFKEEGKKAMFVIKLTNACEKRYRCTVNAYVVTATGPTKGEKVLTLGPKSDPDAATQIYVMPLTMASGMANVSRKCEEL